MKFHNFINTPKILLLLTIILSGCASLSIYDKTYNLVGKISYVSSENSFIAKAIIKIENEMIHVEISDNFLQRNFLNAKSRISGQWEVIGNQEEFDMNLLPSPEILYRLIIKECNKNSICRINQTYSNNNYEVKFILNAI
tara:strand:+ start:881 stop:1300 length:420 start_codon:yes stop_codon:yes gene_type:complete